MACEHERQRWYAFHDKEFSAYAFWCDALATLANPLFTWVCVECDVWVCYVCLCLCCVKMFGCLRFLIRGPCRRIGSLRPLHCVEFCDVAVQQRRVHRKGPLRTSLSSPHFALMCLYIAFKHTLTQRKHMPGKHAHATRRVCECTQDENRERSGSHNAYSAVKYEYKRVVDSCGEDVGSPSHETPSPPPSVHVHVSQSLCPCSI